jgi:hypothetical protein
MVNTRLSSGQEFAVEQGVVVLDVDEQAAELVTGRFARIERDGDRHVGEPLGRERGGGRSRLAEPVETLDVDPFFRALEVAVLWVSGVSMPMNRHSSRSPSANPTSTVSPSVTVTTSAWYVCSGSMAGTPTPREGTVSILFRLT